jgi:hypothetical protein
MSYVTGLITIPPRLSGQKGFVTVIKPTTVVSSTGTPIPLIIEAIVTMFPFILAVYFELERTNVGLLPDPKILA